MVGRKGGRERTISVRGKEAKGRGRKKIGEVRKGK